MNKNGRVGAWRVAVGLGAACWGIAAMADPCLTTSSAQVGDPGFGATVQTFINAGINPNTTCIENGLFVDPAGFNLGTYVKGADGTGVATNPQVIGAYVGGGTPASRANARDFGWVQDVGNTTNFGGGVTGGSPSGGIVWDLGGPANQAVVFVFVDHGPLPQEVLENTAWLSNDPNAADGGWTQAVLTHVYGAGWSSNLADLADGFVAQYQLPGGATFRYVSVSWGGPGSIQMDGDNEIDAVGGLSERGTCVQCVAQLPEPFTPLLVGSALLVLAIARRRRG